MRYTSYSLKKMSLFPAGSYPVNNRRSKHEFVPLYIFYSTSTYHQQNCNDTNSCVLLFIWIVDTWQCLSKASKRAQVGFLEATLEDYCDLLYISTHKRHFLHKLHHIEATTWRFHFHKFSKFPQLLCIFFLGWVSFILLFSPSTPSLCHSGFNK